MICPQARDLTSFGPRTLHRPLELPAPAWEPIRCPPRVRGQQARECLSAAYLLLLSERIRRTTCR